MNEQPFPKAVHTGNIAMRTKLRAFRQAIRRMNERQIAEEIERREYADYAFLAHVIAALEISERPSRTKHVIEHTCKAMELQWSAPLNTAEKQLGLLMLRSALTKSKAWSTVDSHFDDQLPRKANLRGCSHLIRSLFEMQRPMRGQSSPDAASSVFRGSDFYSAPRLQFSIKLNPADD